MAVDRPITCSENGYLSSPHFKIVRADENQIDVDGRIVRIQLEKTTITTDRLVWIDMKEKKRVYQRENQVFFICLTLLASSILYNTFCVIYHRHRAHSLGQIVINVLGVILCVARKILLKEIEVATIDNDRKPKLKNLIMEDRNTAAVFTKELKDNDKIITLNEEKSKKLIKRLKIVKKIGMALLIVNIFLNIEQIYLTQAINNFIIFIIWWKKTVRVSKILQWNYELKDVDLKENDVHQPFDLTTQSYYLDPPSIDEKNLFIYSPNHEDHSYHIGPSLISQPPKQKTDLSPADEKDKSVKKVEDDFDIDHYDLNDLFAFDTENQKNLFSEKRSLFSDEGQDEDLEDLGIDDYLEDSNKSDSDFAKGRSIEGRSSFCETPDSLYKITFFEGTLQSKEIF